MAVPAVAGKECRPHALTVRPNNVPPELITYPQWVAWRYVARERGWGKKPVNVRTGWAADVTDARSWATFDAALQELQKRPDMFDGLGFVFTAGDPFLGIDLDDCRDPATGRLEPWAAEIVAKSTTYAEVSPSRTGVKLFGRGRLPDGNRRRGQVEMYDRDRFFVVTGHRLDGCPAAVADVSGKFRELYDQLTAHPSPHPSPKGAAPLTIYRAPADGVDELVARAMACPKTGPTFRRLWAGDWTGYSSPSEADLALCGRLAFWCGRDPARVAALFEQSGLMRPKWNERHGGRTYGEMTVARALAGARDSFCPEKSTNPSSPLEESTNHLCESSVSSMSGAPSVSGAQPPSVSGAQPDGVTDTEVGSAAAATMPGSKTAAVFRKALFAFARRLKSDPQHAVADPATLRPAVQRWHDLAIARVGPAPFERSWAWFLEGWRRIKHPHGQGPLERLWDESATAQPPRVALRYDDPVLRRLVTFLALLGRHANGRPFPLACRTLAQKLGVHHSTAWSWLKHVLVADGVIEPVTTGNYGEGLASTYRFVGNTKAGDK